ncbi:hypothetical protein K435DRAFT_778861 [Dendrothele bispora CBS 962.96]|uniref:K Homology domain-containing protein n=1 Tax=Dendrothele bispora (strain CBS 962.96) TaxID=1314807 RepID=A0A4S8M1N3_DENBC|nr:hypothetical protein K435DRAFT_778861 [Dendrothele bispora CBS 962.96]
MAIDCDRLAGMLASLVVELQEIKSRLDKLESSLPSLPAKPAASSPSAHTSGVRSPSRKGQLAAPIPTPIAESPTPLPNLNSLSTKAAFEKTVITLSIPDQQTGHVVGRAGTGLRQIHDISHAKISVSPPSGSSGLRSVTIRGTAREVGDAISAIGKRLARKSKKQKKAEGSPPPPVIQNTTPPPITPPSPVPIVHLPKSVTSKPPTPMSITSPTPVSQSKTPSTSTVSPRKIDVVSDDYFRPGPVQPRPGLQTARRGKPFRGYNRGSGSLGH